jgi:hypothetical protein
MTYPSALPPTVFNDSLAASSFSSNSDSFGVKKEGVEESRTASEEDSAEEDDLHTRLHCPVIRNDPMGFVGNARSGSGSLMNGVGKVTGKRISRIRALLLNDRRG